MPACNAFRMLMVCGGKNFSCRPDGGPRADGPGPSDTPPAAPAAPAALVVDMAPPMIPNSIHNPSTTATAAWAESPPVVHFDLEDAGLRGWGGRVDEEALPVVRGSLAGPAPSLLADPPLPALLVLRFSGVWSISGSGGRFKDDARFLAPPPTGPPLPDTGPASSPPPPRTLRVNFGARLNFML